MNDDIQRIKDYLNRVEGINNDFEKEGSVTRLIFLKFSDQKDDARRSFYFLNVPRKEIV